MNRSTAIADAGTQIFRRPNDVVDSPYLTLSEKRAVLASWASDACAVETAPALRRIPGSNRVVNVDEILEALRILDKQAGENGSSWLRRQVRRASIEAFRESRIRRTPGSPMLNSSGSANQEASL